jgi:hypothetical protein
MRGYQEVLKNIGCFNFAFSDSSLTHLSPPSPHTPSADDGTFCSLYQREASGIGGRNAALSDLIKIDLIEDLLFQVCTSRRLCLRGIFAARRAGSGSLSISQ